MALERRRVLFSGRVQGVGFRFFVQHTGNRLGVVGNVRNCPDGTVEIVVEGSDRKIAEFIRQVEKGPSLARVQRVDVVDIPVQGTFGTFQIEGW